MEAKHRTRDVDHLTDANRRRRAYEANHREIDANYRAIDASYRKIDAQHYTTADIAAQAMPRGCLLQQVPTRGARVRAVHGEQWGLYLSEQEQAHARRV
jgi:hypothetical protein